jgi:hypothetical protein
MLPTSWLFLIRAHQTKQVTRLGIVVVADPVIVAIGIPGDLKRRLLESRIFHRSAEAIGLVIDRSAVVATNTFLLFRLPVGLKPIIIGS